MRWKTMDVRHFELDFPRDVDVEKMYFSMNGHELSWGEYQNFNPERRTAIRNLGVSIQSKCYKFGRLKGPSQESSL